MKSSRKLCISALLLPLALFVSSTGCKPSEASKPIVSEAEAAPKPEAIPISLPPSALAFINGTWEGTLDDPLGWSIRFDCFAQNGIQKLLASVISRDFQYLYFPVNYRLEIDGLILWWNDEDNRATIKLQFNQSRQLVGTFYQRQKGGPASGVFVKTSNVPKDGAIPYHGTWKGTLADSLGWSIRFDCFAQNGIQKVLVSITNDKWNLHYLPVNYRLESDSLQLWWNDKDNRATIKLQFNQSGQLAGELSVQQGQQKIAGVFSRTSATPVDGQ